MKVELGQIKCLSEATSLQPAQPVRNHRSPKSHLRAWACEPHRGNCGTAQVEKISSKDTWDTPGCIKREMLSPRLGFMTLSRKSNLRKQRCYSCGRVPYTQRQPLEDGRSLQRKKNDGTTDCILTIFSKQSNVTIADSVCIVLVSLLIQRWFKVCRKKYKGIWKALSHLKSETCASQISGP